MASIRFSEQQPTPDITATNNNNSTITPSLHRHKHYVKGQNPITNKRNNVTKYNRSHL